jgi:hypothetical protein
MQGTTRDRSTRVRREAAAVFAVMAFIAAAVSYRHALQVVRDAGTHGLWAYLPPLLPDGLIYISVIALYEAASSRARRPRWAVAGLVLGCLVTLIMNVASGWPDVNGSAFVNALAPVVLFFALEILTGVLRRGRASTSPPPGAATCDHLPPMSLAEALRAAAPYQSQRELAANFAVSKTTAARKGRPADAPAAATSPAAMATAATSAAAGALNGKTAERSGTP